MSFAALLLGNLFRQRMRTTLTVVGIAVGITTVVALGVITGGLKRTTEQLLRTGGADFMVAQKGAADLTLSIIPEADAARVARVDGVGAVTRTLLHVVKVGSNPYFVLTGYDPRELASTEVDLVSGRLLAPGAADEAMLGVRAAESLDVGPGGSVEIGGRRLRVVGVYRTGSTFADAGAYAPLRTAQRLARAQASLTALYVRVDEGRAVPAVKAAVERALPQLAAISELGEISDVDQGIQIMDAVNLAISLLAVGIGAIGVMNTMVMSVFERTREIGILRAIGWRGSRIIRMIVGESVVLCLLASIVGLGLGVALAQAALLIPTVGSLLEPVYSVGVFARAVAIGMLVGLVGAAYPAFRAVRLSPMEALRHE